MILRPAAVDPSQPMTGDSAGDPDETEVDGCVVWPRTTSEDDYGRHHVIEGITVAMPAGTDVRASDAVRVRGTTYQVAGQPGVFRSPFSGAELVEVNLTRAEG